MGYGGARNPPHIPKGCVSETLRLMLRASHFYPDRERVTQPPSVDSECASCVIEPRNVNIVGPTMF